MAKLTTRATVRALADVLQRAIDWFAQGVCNCPVGDAEEDWQEHADGCERYMEGSLIAARRAILGNNTEG